MAKLEIYRIRRNAAVIMNRFIAPNPAVPRYFSYEDGRTYLPIGQNLCFVRHSEQYTEEEVFALFHRWMRRLAENGGNFARVWLGTPFFDVMPERPGEFSAENRAHVLKIVEFAEELGLKLKFTLEHFRRVAPSAGSDVEQFPGAVNFNKPLYSGLADSMRDYLASDRCRELYLAKAQFLAEAGIGDSPAVIAWELWNEINCIGSIDEIRAWSDTYASYEWQGISTVGENSLFKNKEQPESFLSGKVDLLKHKITLNGCSMTATEGSAVVGNFKNSHGKYAYMVTNAEDPSNGIKTKITITFSDTCSQVKVIRRGIETAVEVSGNSLTLEIDAGEGVFIMSQ